MKNVQLRPATSEDAPVFRRVFELASEGLAPWVWAQAAGPDETIEEVSLRRMRDKLAAAAPGTCIVAELDGTPAGGIVTYDIGDEPEVVKDDTPAVFVPLIRLENQAPRTHYINALAVFPEFTGRGIGRTLLRAAAANARENCMSLIVEDANEAAIGLYRKEGYKEKARLPLVEADGWISPGENWILLVRPSE